MRGKILCFGQCARGIRRAGIRAGPPIRCTDRAVPGRRRQDLQRRHRLDDDVDGPRAADDASRPGAVLRRHGAQEEPAVDHGAEFRHRLPGDRAVGGDRLQPGIHRGLAVDRRHLALRARRPVLRQGWAGVGEPPGADHPRIRVHDVPAHVRHHHAGADHRRVRRTHQVFLDAGVHGAVVAVRLRADGALGVVARWLAALRWACSTSPAAPWCTSMPASPVSPA